MSRIGAVIKRPHRAPSPLYHAMARQEASHRPSPEPAMPAPDLRASRNVRNKFVALWYLVQLKWTKTRANMEH